MNLCKDCRFYVASVHDAPLCSNPKASGIIDLVTGKSPPAFCRAQRVGVESFELETICGYSGKWFEPREPEQVAA